MGLRRGGDCNLALRQSNERGWSIDAKRAHRLAVGREQIDQVAAAVRDIYVALWIDIAVLAETHCRLAGFGRGRFHGRSVDHRKLLARVIEDGDTDSRGSQKVIFPIWPMSDCAQARPDIRKNTAFGKKLFINLRPWASQKDRAKTQKERGGKFPRCPKHGHSDCGQALT